MVTNSFQSRYKCFDAWWGYSEDRYFKRVSSFVASKYRKRTNLINLTRFLMASTHSNGFRNMARTNVPSLILLPVVSSWNQCLYLVSRLLTGIVWLKQPFRCLYSRKKSSRSIDFKRRRRCKDCYTYSYIHVVPELRSPRILMDCIRFGSFSTFEIFDLLPPVYESIEDGLTSYLKPPWVLEKNERNVRSWRKIPTIVIVIKHKRVNMVTVMDEEGPIRIIAGGAIIRSLFVLRRKGEEPMIYFCE